MIKKQSDLFPEEENAQALESKVRQAKVNFIAYRKQYCEFLEKTLAVAFFENRTLNQVENNSLSLFYKRYLDSYFTWLTLREKLSHYTRKVKWLLSSV